MSEKANTALARPMVGRTMPHEAANANPTSSNAANSTRLLVQKHASANATAEASFATGFMRCSRLVPGTYSKNAFIAVLPRP